MPAGSPSRGYAPTNAHVKYTYTAFDQSEVTQRRSWGLNGIKGAGLGFDGGAPTSQRGGKILRKAADRVKGARIGASAHTPKFVMALDNSVSSFGSWNMEPPAARGATEPLRCLTPYAVTLDRSVSEPELMSPRRAKPELSLSVLSSESAELSMASGQALREAQVHAARSSERATTAAAAVRQAIWQRSRQRPCVPEPDEREAWSPRRWTDPLTMALRQSAREASAQGLSSRHAAAATLGASRRPTLRALSADGAEGVAQLLLWAQCDAAHLTALMQRVMHAEQLLNLGEPELAAAGLSPAERRRLLKLLGEMDATNASPAQTRCAAPPEPSPQAAPGPV